MILRVTAVILLTATFAPVHAQSPAAAPEFEVASVRRNTSGSGRSGGRLPDTGMVTITNATIRALITLAYQVDRFTLIDASSNSLMGRDAPTFDIRARPPDDAPPGQQRLMLQKLLTDSEAVRRDGTNTSCSSILRRLVGRCDVA